MPPKRQSPYRLARNRAAHRVETSLGPTPPGGCRPSCFGAERRGQARGPFDVPRARFARGGLPARWFRASANASGEGCARASRWTKKAWSSRGSRSGGTRRSKSRDPGAPRPLARASGRGMKLAAALAALGRELQERGTPFVLVGGIAGSARGRLVSRGPSTWVVVSSDDEAAGPSRVLWSGRPIRALEVRGVSDYFGIAGGGCGGFVSSWTHDERSKKRKIRAFSLALSGAVLQKPGNVAPPVPET